jgi:hypothetical protein
LLQAKQQKIISQHGDKYLPPVLKGQPEETEMSYRWQGSGSMHQERLRSGFLYFQFYPDFKRN